MTTKGRERYYSARVAAELAAAEQASSDRARNAHLELAGLYQRILDGTQEPPSPA